MRYALAAGLVLAAGVAAGCGGSQPPVVASLRTSATAGGRTNAAGGSHPGSVAALARCFTDHGFQAYVGGAGSTGSAELTFFGVTISGNVDPSSPQFQAARRACSKYLPGGGPPPLSAAQKAERVRGFTRFAACMRKHGVPSFPGPDSAGTFPLDAVQQLNPGTTTFQSAFKACEGLMAKVGPQIRLG